MGIFDFFQKDNKLNIDGMSHLDKKMLKSVNKLLEHDFVKIIKPNFNFIINENEYPVREEAGDLFEERNVRTHIGAGTQVMKGVYVGGAKSYNSGELNKLDSGNILFTTKRIIFVGDKRTLNISYNNLVAVQHLLDGIRINYDNRQKASIVTVDYPKTCATLIHFLSQNQMTKAFSDVIVKSDKIISPEKRKSISSNYLEFETWFKKYDEAQLYMKSNDYSKAINIYENLLNSTFVSSDYKNVVIELIGCYAHSRQFDNALSLIEYYQGISPESEELLTQWKDTINKEMEENKIDKRLDKLTDEMDDLMDWLDET